MAAAHSLARTLSAAVFVASSASVSLSGCASTAQMRVAAVANQPIATKATKQQARDAVAQGFISEGYAITKDSDFVLEFSRAAKGWGAVLLSSNYDSNVQVRVAVSFVGDGPTTVTWRAYYVTNPGSGFERLTDVSNGADAPVIQARIANALAAV